MSTVFTSKNFIHLLASRELGARVPLFADQNFLIHNIKEDNYAKKMFKGHSKRIDVLDVQGDFAATVSDVIKLWNLKTGECLWTFDPTPKVYWGRTIKIIETSVVCTGRVETLEGAQCDDTIRVIDLKTGVEKSSITDHQLETEKVCIFGSRIFCACDNGHIGEWDFKGNLIRWRRSEKLIGRTHQFLGLGNFLVEACGDNIIIRDIPKNIVRKIEFRGKEVPDISSAYIDGHRLICGFSSDQKRNLPHCCVIDLESGNIIDQYQAMGAFENESSESGQVLTVIANLEWAYLGHSTGTIVAINFSEKRHVILGKHIAAVHDLVIEGDLLISGSRSYGINQPTELKFWDTRSMKKIGEINLPFLSGISFISGKVLAASGKSLVQFDYFVAHKDEKIAKKIVRR